MIGEGVVEERDLLRAEAPRRLSPPSTAQKSAASRRAICAGYRCRSCRRLRSIPSSTAEQSATPKPTRPRFPQRAGSKRRPMARPIVREKFALKARYVHSDGTLRFAGAAFQAKIQYVVHALIAQPRLTSFPVIASRACWPGRAWSLSRRASPCKTDTWSRKVSCGTLRRRCTSRPLRRSRRNPNSRTTWSDSACGIPRRSEDSK